MKRVLVTGARGFIGRNVLGPLATRGYETVAVTSGTMAITDPDVRWVTCDLFDEQAMERLVDSVQPTHLLHLAWCTEHGRFWNGRENLLWLAASVRLLDKFTAAGGRRAVMAGSCAEYDWTAPQPCVEYATPLRPHTLYGTCKKALMEVATVHASRTSLSLAWGRIFLLHGPWEDPSRFVADLIRSMLLGKSISMTEGLQQRDLLYSSDVASALVALLDSPICGAVNIGSGEHLRLIDVATHIASRLDGFPLLKVGAIPSRPDDPGALYPDVSRLRDEVGWVPRYTVSDGLDESIKWWRTQIADRIDA